MGGAKLKEAGWLGVQEGPARPPLPYLTPPVMALSWVSKWSHHLLYTSSIQIVPCLVCCGLSLVLCACLVC